MDYRKKRVRAGLSAYTVAKEMGVEYDKYLNVEQRKLNLEKDLLDKFLKIISNAKMLKFNRKQTIRDIKQFINEGKLKDLMAQRGYNGVSLARVLNLSNSLVSKVLKGKYYNDDTIEMIYDFLQNPINAYVDEEKSTAEISWKDLKKIKEEKGFSIPEIAEGTGLTDNVVNHAINDGNAKQSKIEKIYNFLINNEKKEIDLVELEYILKSKKKSKSQLSKEMGIEYHFVYNFFKGKNINRKMKEKIATYIKGLETPITPQIEETPQMITPEIEEIVEPIVELEPISEEINEESPIVPEDVETIEDGAENGEIIDIEDFIADGVIKDEVQSNIDKDIFEILKENNDLKEKLAKANRQIMLYEKLIERL